MFSQRRILLHCGTRNSALKARQEGVEDADVYRKQKKKKKRRENKIKWWEERRKIYGNAVKSSRGPAEETRLPHTATVPRFCALSSSPPQLGSVCLFFFPPKFSTCTQCMRRVRAESTRVRFLKQPGKGRKVREVLPRKKDGRFLFSTGLHAPSSIVWFIQPLSGASFFHFPSPLPPPPSLCCFFYLLPLFYWAIFVRVLLPFFCCAQLTLYFFRIAFLVLLSHWVTVTKFSFVINQRRLLLTLSGIRI